MKRMTEIKMKKILNFLNWWHLKIEFMFDESLNSIDWFLPALKKFEKQKWIWLRKRYQWKFSSRSFFYDRKIWTIVNFTCPMFAFETFIYSPKWSSSNQLNHKNFPFFAIHLCYMESNDGQQMYKNFRFLLIH